MGTPYNGLNANIALPSSIAISSSVVGTVTTINTSTAHGLLTGDYVNIYNHLVNTGANCVAQPVTVTSTTQFTIPVNTTGGTNGVATGNVYPLQFTGNVGLNPANGDAGSASTWIPGMSCTQDRTSGLLARSSIYRITAAGLYNFNATSGTSFFSPWIGSAVTLNASTFTKVADLGSTTFVSTSDHVEFQVDFSANFVLSGGSAAATMSVVFALFYSFVPYGSATSFSQVLYSAKSFSQQNFASNTPTIPNLPYTLVGELGAGSNTLTLAAPNTVGSLDIQLSALGQYSTSGGVLQVQPVGDMVAQMRVYRPNGVNP